MDVTVRMLDESEGAVLERVDADVFDHAVDAALAAEFLADSRHHIAVALLAGEVVAMATGVHYVHPDKAAEFWVNEVGVAPAHHRRGLATQLMQALFERARQLGCREAWLGTEEGNAAARALYSSLGGREEAMVHVTFALDSEVTKGS